MKTKNTVLALVAVFASALTFATNPSKMAVIGQENSGTFKVIYQGETAGKVTLKVYNSNNEEIFAETINGLNGFIRPLNFEGLKSGVYTIEINDANGKQVQKVSFSANDHKIAAKETSITGVHVSRLRDGKYLVSVANQGAEKINIRIFDINNNLVYDEYHTATNGLGLVYNLKEVAGTPVFMITDAAGKNHTVK